MDLKIWESIRTNTGPYAIRDLDFPKSRRVHTVYLLDSELLRFHMFSIRHRYIFITLIAAYTFGNILLARINSFSSPFPSRSL